MKAKDLYNSPVVSEESDFYCLLEKHIDNLSYDIDDSAIEDAGRIVVKKHIDPYMDGYRCFEISSVWFDGKPVMIIREAGRSGQDENDEFITNLQLYDMMTNYIKSFRVPDESFPASYDEDKDIPELDEFYGHKVTVDMCGLINDRKNWLYHLCMSLVNRRKFFSKLLTPEPIVERLQESLTDLKKIDEKHKDVYVSMLRDVEKLGIDFPMDLAEKYIDQIEMVLILG